MSLIFWPEYLAPRDIDFSPLARSMATMTNLNGVTTVTGAVAPAWKVTFIGVPVHGELRVLKWREIEALAEGRRNKIVLPVYNHYQSGRSFSEREPSTPHSDDTFFDDGTGYAENFWDVRTSAFATYVPGVTSLVVRQFAGNGPKPGQNFSLNNQLYRIKTVVTLATDSFEISFTPPLRKSVAPSTVFEMDRPTATVRLAKDDGMSLSAQYGRYGSVDVEFVEAY
jgi:hypothetical protein